MPMSEEDEVFLERSFQRTLIASYQRHPLNSRIDIRNWKNLSRTLLHRLQFGGEQAKFAMQTQSSAVWSERASLS